MVDDTRLMVREVIQGAIEVNRPPRSTALDIVGRVNNLTGLREGGLLGLTSQQAGYVQNMRAELADPEKMANYFTRARRDKRFDSAVRKAMEAAKPVIAADIDKITGRYADRLLKLRGNTIAQQEAFSALAAGQHEGWRQLIDTGTVAAGDVTKRWQHNHNNPARKDHIAMDGKVVTFDQPFIFPDGTQMQHDHDPAGGAKSNLGCHCTTFYRLRKGRPIDG